MPHFTKSHGLGNDYLVADPRDLPFELTPERTRLICDYHFGVGSDGILLLGERGEADFGMRVLNPDGSEAEKSGNGVRIFAKWLRDTGRATTGAFRIGTLGGVISVEVEPSDGPVRHVTADMGVPVIRDDLVSLDVDGQTLPLVALSIGNPHCVVLRDELDARELRALGPQIERHPAFPERTNVQFAHVVDRGRVQALIWERGAGETLASGSSSCAVAVACHHMALVDPEVVVEMPGGELPIRIALDEHVWMRGPAEEVGTVTLSDEMLARLSQLASA